MTAFIRASSAWSSYLLVWGLYVCSFWTGGGFYLGFVMPDWNGCCEKNFSVFQTVLFWNLIEEKLCFCRFDLCCWRYQQWRSRATFCWSLWPNIKTLVWASSHGHPKSLSWCSCSQRFYLRCGRLERISRRSCYCRKILLWRGMVESLPFRNAHWINAV